LFWSPDREFELVSAIFTERFTIVSDQFVTDSLINVGTVDRLDYAYIAVPESRVR